MEEPNINDLSNTIDKVEEGFMKNKEEYESHIEMPEENLYTLINLYTDSYLTSARYPEFNTIANTLTGVTYFENIIDLRNRVELRQPSIQSTITSSQYCGCGECRHCISSHYKAYRKYIIYTDRVSKERYNELNEITSKCFKSLDSSIELTKNINQSYSTQYDDMKKGKEKDVEKLKDEIKSIKTNNTNLAGNNANLVIRNIPNWKYNVIK